MTRCQRQSSSDIELYFYGELEAAERSAVERHLRSCSDCRQALEELSTIRAALAARPRVDAPADADWTEFMQRLDRAVQLESRGGPPVAAVREGPQWPTYLAMAALLALVITLQTAVVDFWRLVAAHSADFTPHHRVELLPLDASESAV